MKEKKVFGSFIKQKRLEKNYSQRELAELLYVTESAVSKWERGVTYPDITLFKDICNVLDITEHELIESSQDVTYRKMEKDAKKFNKIKKGLFWAFNILYAVSILTCFIVNLAVNHTLSWFFIVFAAISCAYAFCPTITWVYKKNKNLLLLGSTFISMFLLFLTCSIYTNNYWFMIATLGVLLGYFIIFYPILFNKQKSCLSEEKYNKLSKWFLLSYISGILIIVNLLLIVICLYHPYNLKLGLLITEVCFVVPMMFGVLNLLENGRSLGKIALIALAVIFVVLSLVVVGRSLYLKSTIVSKTYSIEEVYKDIKIDGINCDISVYVSSDNENKVVYSENKKVTFDIKVIDGVLTIIQEDDLKFYDKVFNYTHLKVELYLTKTQLQQLSVNNKTGDIIVTNSFTFNNVKLNASTGDIVFKSNITNDLTVTTLTGDANLENCKIDGSVSVKATTGDIKLIDVKCNKLDVEVSTGNTKLINTIVTGDMNLNGTTGDILFDGFDAENIYVTVSTGDIKGTIITSKIFNARSKTGKIETPETYTGGICKLITSTGNIIISYK